MSPPVADQSPSAADAAPTGVTIVVPTYKEVENLPVLIERLDKVRQAHNLDVELLIMDDNSQDGSEELIRKLDKDWVRLIVRTTNRGLSPAVVDGLKQAKHDRIVVMDADLSHPPEKIPDMLQLLGKPHDFVIGSRYVPGGKTDAEWGVFRWLNSKIATLMARPFTKARDPMAGFFALEKRTFEQGVAALNPIGYKIGLELIVKCNCRSVGEVPIYFQDRQLGKSKLNFKEQLRYVQHLRRLFIYRYWTWSHLLQFLVVGMSGVVVNMAVLALLLKLDLSNEVALAGGIAVSMVSNFALNRRFTFSYARTESMWRQFVGFVAACALGALVNWIVAALLTDQGMWVFFAAMIGIVAGMGFNFLCTRFFVFRFKAANPEKFRAPN